MHPDDGVDALDALGSGIRVVAVEIRVGADIDGFSAVDNLSELWTELRVRCISTGPQCVAS